MTLCEQFQLPALTQLSYSERRSYTAHRCSTPACEPTARKALMARACPQRYPALHGSTQLFILDISYVVADLPALISASSLGKSSRTAPPCCYLRPAMCDPQPRASDIISPSRVVFY
mgnify:CR=1 FL=1